MKKKFLIYLLFSTLLYGEKLQLLFVGNKEIASRELYSSLEFSEPYFYEFYKDNPIVELKTIDLITQTIKDYYKSKGFFHTNVTYTKDNKFVTIRVEENLPITIRSLSNISDLDLDKNIPFKVGDIFDANKFTQSKKDIKTFYENNNFCNASIDAKAWIDIELNEAYIKYESYKNEKCYFGKVTIVPSENIDKEIIESILYIKENESYSPEKITQSYESLYSYEGISKATINTETVDENIVDVSINITENEKPLRFEFAVGASSDEGAMVSTGIINRNFLGNLKILSLKTKIAQIKQDVKLNFDMPLSNRNFAGFETGYENEKFIDFKESRLFSSIYLKEKISSHIFKESLVFDRIDTYDSDDEILFPPSNLFVLSPKLEYNYDARDKILDPASGYFINGEMTGSLKSEISDATYYKLKATGGYIHSLQNSIVALKGTYGTLKLIDGAIPSSYRFFAGGMHSNRGYGYRKLGATDSDNNPIGSDSILEATAELRFKIYGDFRGIVFNDNTYLGNDNIPDYNNGYHSAGFGLRYKTPIGSIAIDAGFDIFNPTDQYAFHFHIGELF